MKKLTWKDIGYALSPAFLYTVLINVIYSLLQSVAGGRLSGLMLQAAASVVCLVLFGGWAVSRQGLRFFGTGRSVYRCPAAFCYVCAVVMWGIACNQIIFLSGLKNSSEGYRHVAQVFYGNSLLLEIVALCILGPLLEELVYRGSVYGRFCEKAGTWTAVIGSALIFGLLHLNLVQCIYAFTAGLLLAYIVSKTGSLATAAVAHGAMNLVSVLWTETDWLNFLNQTGTTLYVLTGVCLLLMVIFVSDGNRLIRRAEKKI